MNKVLAVAALVVMFSAVTLANGPAPVPTKKTGKGCGSGPCGGGGGDAFYVYDPYSHRVVKFEIPNFSFPRFGRG